MAPTAVGALAPKAVGPTQSAEGAGLEGTGALRCVPPEVKRELARRLRMDIATYCEPYRRAGDLEACRRAQCCCCSTAPSSSPGSTMRT